MSVRQQDLSGLAQSGKAGSMSGLLSKGGGTAGRANLTNKRNLVILGAAVLVLVVALLLLKGRTTAPPVTINSAPPTTAVIAPGSVGVVTSPVSLAPTTTVPPSQYGQSKNPFVPLVSSSSTPPG